MYKVHDGCAIVLTEVVAVWSERYSDPKLDADSHLVRVMLKNNSTILTVGSYASKAKADRLVKEISSIKK